MFKTLKNAWKVEDLRKKILFTLFILLIYRIGNAITVPYVNTELLKTYFTQIDNTALGLLNTISGGSFSQATIFALSIQPYINASIIIQLLCIAIPALERLSKEGGEEGKKKIEAITRYSTVVIGLLQGFGFYYMLNSYGYLEPGIGLWGAIVIIATFTAGSTLLMWLGEQISEFGIGNGISIILFVSIVSRLPSAVITMVGNLASGALKWYGAVGIVLGVLLLVVLIVYVTNAERRIPIQYAKRVVGRKVYGGQNTHLPMKVNMSGVMPIIFASTIASLPATVAAFIPNGNEGWVMRVFDTGGVAYPIIYFLLILAFAYFYSTIQFNPIEVANNLKKNGGFIPGYRAGRPTADFIRRVLNKITLFGAIYLGIVAILPFIFSSASKLGGISLGGTSIIIAVGVAIELQKGIEDQLLLRHYKGFLE
ncbi:MAG: preprotein translocase subunit SecY [Oscillospiraceae bacterium]|nr:preprotein translocase subunit SecY [Oscillospiraceae bacterium]